jgi:hypothetical protein
VRKFRPVHNFLNPLLQRRFRLREQSVVQRSTQQECRDERKKPYGLGLFHLA